METMIAEVYVPAIGITYDFQLPAGVPVEAVISQLVQILENTEQNLSFDDEMPVLCLSGEGIPLPLGATLAESGVRDGTRLLLL